MAENLGASFSIDVSDLKAGIAQANRLIRESESEFKAAAAGLDDWSDSEDGLNAKIKSLNNITDIQRKKVGALQKEYDSLIADGLDPTSRGAVELRTKINNETAALNKNEAELKKQTKALDQLGKESKETAKDTEDMGGKFEGLKKASGIAVGAIAAIGAACVAGVSAFLGLAESTKETQTAMAKLETAFQTAFGNTEIAAENATTSMYDLYGVLGDMDRSVEASVLLAKMSKDEADLQRNTRILTGVFSEFGDSIPSEALAEGMQATAEMGTVQGVLADALEWQGVNLDEYNAKLASMSTAEERAAYIQSTLIDLYGESADKYRENNKALIESNEAQLRLEQSLADIGEIALPIMTSLKNFAAQLLQAITPFVQLIGEGLTGAFNGAADAEQKLADGLSGVLTTALDNIVEMIPTALGVVTSMIPAALKAIMDAAPKILSAVGEILPEATEMLLSQLPLLVSCISGLVSQLLGLLGTLIPQIVQQIISVLPSVVQSIISAAPQLLQAAIQFLMAIVRAIPTLLNSLLSELPTIIDTILSGILSAFPDLMSAAIQLFSAIVEAIPMILDSLIQNLPMIIDSIITGLLDALPMLLDAAIQLLMAIISAIPTICNVLFEKIPEIVSTIVSALLNRLPDVINGAIQLFMGIIKAIPSIIVELGKQIPSIIKSIVSGLGKGISQVKDVGKNLIKGLWEGISDMVGWIGEKIKGFGETVLGGLKSFFGIKSPSRVMADQVGKNLALGIGKGFEDNIADVNDEITSAMNFDDANVSVNGVKRGGGVTVYQTNNYSQAHSRYEIYKSKKQTEAAVRLALGV